MYSSCCVGLTLSYLQRLLCGFACISYSPCTGVAVWHCPYPICSACCVVLLLSDLQRLLGGIAPILFAELLCGLASILCTAFAGGIATFLFAALAVWSCFYLMYIGCCVALPLSYLQRLLCGLASI